MLDGVMRKIIDRPLNALGNGLSGAGITANAMTLLGLGLGLAAAIAIAAGWMLLGFTLLILSRLADGLDGAIARATKPTDFGGYLDITADFLFYGAIPLGFILNNPGTNALAGAFLLVAFYFNGGTFLGYAILAEKHELTTEQRGIKSLYFTEGLMEGTETILFFVLCILVPGIFPVLATLFALLTFATAIGRLMLAYRQFGEFETKSNLVEGKADVSDQVVNVLKSDTEPE